MIIHFITVDSDDRMLLCAAEITEDDRENGFYVHHGFIPPYFMFDSEHDALQVLRQYAAEVGLEIRSALN